jgi:hypothetical protein
MKDLKEIKGVEIFSAGVWNGDEYSINDIDEMVRAFEENKGTFRPYLKLGHNDDQQLVQNDGLPAAGWIGQVYRMGDKLMADFVDIPAKIFELIENKAYRKVSSEIYWNISIKDKMYSKMLAAVALLGADTPAVMNLNDILSLYGFMDKIKIYNSTENKGSLKRYDYFPTQKGDAMEKTEQELKLEQDLKAQSEQLASLEAELKNHKADAEAKQAELDTLRQEKERLEKAALDAELARQETEKEAFMSQLVSEKLITPAMKPLVQALLGQDSKEYSFGEGEQVKKFSKNDLVKEILKLHTASDVNVDESSTEGAKNEVNTDDAVNEKIEKYMQENNCSYKSAYKAIVRDVKLRESIEMTDMAAE